MKFLTPTYYNAFKCKASACSDNCCIGWEICIDEDTASFYGSVGGSFGQRLRKNISYTDEPSFILQGERCPFLNKKGLCDIITTLGENALCQICRDHPRYFEWYGNVKEGGIGLSCEEGARLILNHSNYLTLYESEVDEWIDEDFDTDTYKALFNLRRKLFALLENDLAFSEKASKMLSFYKKDTSFSLSGEIKKALPFLEKTESVNPLWDEKFSLLKDTYLKENAPALVTTAEDEKRLCNLTAYFLWRYFMKSVFDGDEEEKIKLTLFSASVIFALYSLEKDKNETAWIKASVLFSKQMEYSDENIKLFYKEY